MSSWGSTWGLSWLQSWGLVDIVPDVSGLCYAGDQSNADVLITEFSGVTLSDSLSAVALGTRTRVTLSEVSASVTTGDRKRL